MKRSTRNFITMLLLAISITLFVSALIHVEIFVALVAAATIGISLLTLRKRNGSIMTGVKEGLGRDQKGIK